MQLTELRKNLFLNRRKLKELQLKRLKLLLKHSYENVLFYRQKFDQARIKPDDIRTLEHLSKIPITTREELYKLPSEFTSAKNIPLSQYDTHSTSGTTGMPLSIFIDRRASEYGYGLWGRAYERNGLRNMDKMAVIRHPDYFPRNYWFQKFGIQPRKYISALEETENQISVLEKYKPQAIKSYPSCMAEIARTLKERPRVINPRLIFTGGELLSQESRALISSVFETEPLDTYGTTEFSLVAWECREHSGYHINADSVLMEFLDGEEEVAVGERGTIVCTGLNNYAMPLIRYKNDDIAVPLDEECSCGVKLPLLRSIEGRESDLLMAIDGHFVSPWHFFPFPFKDFTGIRQFKIIQDRKDRILLQVVAEEGTVDEYRLNEARTRMKKLFGEAMRVDFEFVDDLKKGPTGKMRAISRLF